MNEPATIREILDRTQTIAVVGLTNREGRASLGVSRYMQSQGYRILPVNPQIDSALGEKAFPDLDEAVAAAGGAVELVNVFPRPGARAGDCEGRHPAEDPVPLAAGRRGA